ncbi:kinesin-like protein KIF6 isoform X1 [Lampetra planeri]
MVKQTIQIYARLKPARKNAAGLYSVEEDDGRTPLLEFVVPRDLAEGFVNNKRESYKFQFKKIFDQQAKQEEIFETIARPVADSVLSGYNGTIFAYGQTGSGKTFTITGGAERFADRGIIPRILGYLFEQFQKDTNRVYTAHISYLEIYNENGYDLLNPRHEASKLEDLPKVTLMEDTEQIVHLKNLSLHQASSQEEALNLLFLGDTNRMIAETPMNQASTRSHCIFTLHVCGREPGSTTLCRSKLHLVDLAGSERVSKTGVGGILLTEAKYINLSLHYLEQVIIALSEKNRSHVPYRNSMMTSVLRDSLGGNCMTTMIATLAVDKRNIDESISTCRFAQRVALIKNEAILNEEVDPRLVIVRLKKEIQQLRDELALVTGQPRTEDLDAVELQQLEEMVRGYVEDADADASLEVGADMRKIHHCFSLLKRHIRQGRASSGGSERENPSKKNDDPGSESDIRRLKELVQQRDNEINVLVSMLKKERKHVQDVGRQLQALTGERDGGPKVDGQRETVAGYDKESEWVPAQSRDHYMSSSSSFNGKNSASTSATNGMQLVYGEKSTGRKEAFDIFRRDYADNITIEDNKYILKQRYAEAKALGETVNQARSKINQLKSQIDHRRMQRAAQGVSKALPGVDESDPVEEDLRARIEGEKSSYKEAFTRLKVLKTEIEHLQHLLEKAKLKLQRDFDDWWAGEVARRAVSSQGNQARRAAIPCGSGGDPYNQSANRSSASSRFSSASSTLSIAPSASQHSSFTRSIEAPGSTIPLTGDSKIDADILAFVQARQKLTHGKAQEHR